jgi:hypothetical protein
MNAERLHAIALALREDFDRGGVVEGLGGLADAVTALASNPADVEAQARVARQRDAGISRLRDSRSAEFPPVWEQQLDDLGLARFSSPRLADEIEAAFVGNELTPVVPRDRIIQLRDEVQAAQNMLDQLLAGLRWVNVPPETLQPGEFEISILIPRPQVDNSLQGLADEFRKLTQMILPFSELFDGSRPPLEVRSISSSDFGVFLLALPGVALTIAQAVKMLTASWKDVEEIKQMRAGLAEKGFTGPELAAIDTNIETRIKTQINVYTQELLELHAPSEVHRQNELENDIRHALNALSNRIERGFRIDADAGPALPSAEGEDADDAAPTPEAEEQEAIRARVRAINDELRRTPLSTAAPFLALPESDDEEHGDEADAASPDGGG